MAIAAIAQTGRQRPMGDDIVVGHLVQGRGGDARLDQGNQQVQRLGGQAAGPAHTLKIACLVQGHGKMGLAGGFKIVGLG